MHRAGERFLLFPYGPDYSDRGIFAYGYAVDAGFFWADVVSDSGFDAGEIGHPGTLLSLIGRRAG